MFRKSLVPLVTMVVACSHNTSELPSDNDAAATSEFGRMIATLSEPGSYFDTDNLISNETSLFHVASYLIDSVPEGGAYIGVGPDQNFSYVAMVKPSVALMLDIRRDNMLHHLLLKAAFELSPTRAGFLRVLLGRDIAKADGRSGRELVDAAIAATVLDVDSLRAVVDSVVLSFGAPVGEDDIATINRFHREFLMAGVQLRFRTHNRAPQNYYPTLGDLIAAHDLDGNEQSYLASDDAYATVRHLQLEDRIVPVVGDLAGDSAIRSIGRFLRSRDQKVTAFYTSNVEYYLWQDGTLGTFMENVRQLPLSDGGVVIRSLFVRTAPVRHPEWVPGFASVQLLQPFDELLRLASGAASPSYPEILMSGYIPLASRVP